MFYKKISKISSPRKRKPWEMVALNGCEHKNILQQALAGNPCTGRRVATTGKAGLTFTYDQLLVFSFGIISTIGALSRDVVRSEISIDPILPQSSFSFPVPQGPSAAPVPSNRASRSHVAVPRGPIISTVLHASPMPFLLLVFVLFDQHLDLLNTLSKCQEDIETCASPLTG